MRFKGCVSILPNYVLLCIVNAQKFAFQDLYFLDLKPAIKTHQESQSKVMDNRKYLKGTVPFTVNFNFLKCN